MSSRLKDGACNLYSRFARSNSNLYQDTNRIHAGSTIWTCVQAAMAQAVFAAHPRRSLIADSSQTHRRARLPRHVTVPGPGTHLCERPKPAREHGGRLRCQARSRAAIGAAASPDGSDPGAAGAPSKAATLRMLLNASKIVEVRTACTVAVP